MLTVAHRINKQTTIAVVRPWPAITAAALTTTVTVMPGFARGPMATPIAADLHLSRTARGLAMSGLLRDIRPVLRTHHTPGWTHPPEQQATVLAALLLRPAPLT